MTKRATILTIMLGATMATAPAAWADDTATALYDKKCKICHSIAGDAGKLGDKGGALDGIGTKRDEAYLRAFLADPKSKNPDSKMPNLKLTPADIDALVGYLLTLK